MPQIGDYRTEEGVLVAFAKGVLEGCGIGGLFGGVAGCVVGVPYGVVASLIIWLLETKNDYKVDLTRWCQQNYTNCQNNEYYLRVCAELIDVE
ncbi:hypothetical protein [Rhodothermus profundi]|nr:hypothetical protein [Rhodothermus profundi]